MKTLIAKARLVVCLLVVVAFFLPAYNGVSGLGFIELALIVVNSESGVTMADAIFLIAPLIMVPISALIIGIRGLLRISTRKTAAIFPMLFLGFFTFLLIVSSRNGNGSFSSPKALLHMQPGFYLACLATLTLPFTKNIRRRKSRRRTSSQVAETTIAA